MASCARAHECHTPNKTHAHATACRQCHAQGHRCVALLHLMCMDEDTHPHPCAQRLTLLHIAWKLPSSTPSVCHATFQALALSHTSPTVLCHDLCCAWGLGGWEGEPRSGAEVANQQSTHQIVCLYKQGAEGVHLTCHVCYQRIRPNDAVVRMGPPTSQPLP
jgi:hypothetical protein